MPDSMLLTGGALVYGAASAAAFAGLRKTVTALLIGGASLFTIAVVLRWRALGHGPFLTLHEVLLSNLCSLGWLYAAIIARWPAARGGAPWVFAVLAALALWLLTTSSEARPLPATYDNPWLWAHVGLGKVFLALCLAATGLSLATSVGRHSSQEQMQLDRLAWDLMTLAFTAETFMLVAGAAWAQDAWGRYWSWDPLETSALLTWLTLGLVLHLRLRHPLPLALGCALMTLVLVLAVLTFLGLPFLSVAPHKGIA